MVQQLRSNAYNYSDGQEVTMFIKPRHMRLCWASWVQFTPLHTIYIKSILILSSYVHSGLPSSLFLSGFPTEMLHAFLFRSSRLPCLTHLILLDFIVLTMTRRIPIMKLIVFFPQCFVTSHPEVPEYLPQHCSQAYCVCFIKTKRPSSTPVQNSR
jgi:hypothetical protein